MEAPSEKNSPFPSVAGHDRGSFLIIPVVVVVMILLSLIAFRQRSVASNNTAYEPHRSGPVQWLLKPIDCTPVRRLPAVRSNLHDLLVRGDTVLVVGSGGLLMRSIDGGASWKDTVVSFSYRDIRAAHETGNRFGYDPSSRIFIAAKAAPTRDGKAKR